VDLGGFQPVIGRNLTLPRISRALWNAQRRIGAGGTIYELAGAVPGAPGAVAGCAPVISPALILFHHPAFYDSMPH
jgi:hypothetical protein